MPSLGAGACLMLGVGTCLLFEGTSSAAGATAPPAPRQIDHRKRETQPANQPEANLTAAIESALQEIANSSLLAPRLAARPGDQVPEQQWEDCVDYPGNTEAPWPWIASMSTPQIEFVNTQKNSDQNVWGTCQSANIPY